MAEYVYGILDEEATAPAEKGIAGRPLRMIEGGGAAALVSEVNDQRLRLGREEVLAHARVLAQALEQGTVLPMRFGVVMTGPEEVRRRLLDGHRDELRTQLESLAGKVEINIRATYEEDRLMREVVREDPRIAQLRDELKDRPEDATYYQRIELGELVAKAVERKREGDARDIVEALMQVAVACEPAPPSHERVALRAAFLVAREKCGEFDAVVDAYALGQAGRLRFKYAGPLPPHSFVHFTGEASSWV